MQERNTQGMWGRYALFILLSFAILLVNIYVMSVLNPRGPGDQKAGPGGGMAAAPPAAPGAEVPDEAEKREDQPRPPEGELQPEQPGLADIDVEKVADEQAEPVVEEVEAEIPPQSVTLGSLEPSSGHRMLVTLTNRGAAVVRTELNGSRFHNLEDRSGYLGQIVMDETAEGHGCPVDVVGPGTPAAVAGLIAGDLITKVDQTPITGFRSLRSALLETKPKQTITLTVSRQGKELVLPVGLRRRPLELLRPEADVPLGRGDELCGLRGVRPSEDDPLSFLLTLSQIDDLKLADVVKKFKKENPDPEELDKRSRRERDESIRLEIDGVNLRGGNWEVLPGNSESEVAFRRVLPKWGLEITKKYRLAKVPKEAVDDDTFKGYHLFLDVEVRNARETERKVAYQLDGPTGLPTEGYWYANKIGRRWGAVGLRDVAISFEQRDPDLVPCPKIAVGKWGTVWREEPEQLLTFIGVDAQYFSAVMTPTKREPGHVRFAELQPLLVGPVDPTWSNLADTSCRLTSTLETLKPGDVLWHSYEIFAGPKNPDLLSQYGLKELLYYGWFGEVAKAMLWLLHRFYSLVGNYGLAILMLTVLVRLCMFPLSKKQALGAQKMAELQPEIKKIQEKHKKDMEARTKAQQDLFKKHKYNPLSGCLVMFLQLPIFIGLYRGLMVDVELRQAPLISEGLRWCSNLSAPDMFLDWSGFMPAFITSNRGFLMLGPYLNLLPIVTIVLFLVQSKMLMPPPADEQAKMQQNVMKFMMIFMGIIFFKVASGLCIYFIASTLWGLAERQFLPKKRAAPASDGGTRQSKPQPAKAPPRAVRSGDGAAAGKKVGGDGAPPRKKKRKKSRGRR